MVPSNINSEHRLRQVKPICSHSLPAATGIRKNLSDSNTAFRHTLTFKKKSKCFRTCSLTFSLCVFYEKNAVLCFRFMALRKTSETKLINYYAKNPNNPKAAFILRFIKHPQVFFYAARNTSTLILPFS
jgi:hypothetical protein